MTSGEHIMLIMALFYSALSVVAILALLGAILYAIRVAIKEEREEESKSKDCNETEPEGKDNGTKL